MNIRVDHKGHCLYGSEPTVQIIKAVGSKFVKINWDLYHMQITEGDLCGHLREGFAADAIGYIQIADHPGRNEPGTGEIHYSRVLQGTARRFGTAATVGLELVPKTTEEAAAQAVYARTSGEFVAAHEVSGCSLEIRLRSCDRLIGKSSRCPMPKKVAAIVTEYRKWSHADVILGKILDGYPDGKKPGLELVVAVHRSGAEERHEPRPGQEARLHDLRHHRRRLTLGGKTLAVDGVLSIGEHGNYPNNEKGQKLYPRRRFFEEICKVFEATGKVGAGVQRQAPRRDVGATRSGCTTGAEADRPVPWPARRSR